MLAVITLRKCGKNIDYFRAACRDIDRETPLEVSPSQGDTDWQALARDPLPDEAALLTETVEQLMSHLDTRHRRIVSLKLQGHSTADISSQVGLTERTVQRVLVQVKKWLQRRVTDDSDDRRHQPTVAYPGPSKQ